MRTKIAILGRPNVGKSTLFNRLTGSRRALVHDRPGVTRDRIDGKAKLFDLEFDIVDTAGLEVGMKGELSDRLVEISMAGLAKADVGLLLIDARAGITALDSEIAKLLHQQDKPIILVANKCEGRAAEAEAAEAWGLGLGEPVAVSAEHGLGLDTLAERLRPYVSPPPAEGEEEEVAPAKGSRRKRRREEETANEAEIAEENDRLHLAIVGRPNTGKSSLVNRLLHEQRQLTGPEPGLTRDSVNIVWQWRGRPIELVDTAGLRRKAKIDDKLEQLTTSATVRAIRGAHVVVLMLDATQPLEKQDLTIANLVLRQGRALVVVVNKWDLAEDPKELLAEIRHRAGHKLSQLKHLPILTMSVLNGRGVEKLLPTVIDIFDRWSTRISTARLNRWLRDALTENPPPMAQNRRIKIRYATQIAARPPAIALFANKPEEAIPSSYLRYLSTNFSRTFNLEGIDIRLYVRHGENPYDDGAGGGGGSR